MSSAKPPMPSATQAPPLVLMVWITSVLPGCLDEAPPTGEIPYPREGDGVTYETGQGTLLSFLAWGDAGAPSVEPLQVGATFRVVQDIAWENQARNETIDHFVDVDSNRVAVSMSQCVGDECADGYRLLDFSQEGMPWAGGSSIFQGRVLSVGERFSESFPLGRAQVMVEFEVIDGTASDDGTEFVVEGTPTIPEAPAFYHGRWRVTTRSPFVLSHEASQSFLEAGADPVTLNVSMVAVQLVEGAGEEQQFGSGTFQARTSLPVSAFSGLPKGFEADLGWNGLTFQGAWTFLSSRSAEAREDAKDPSFTIAALQAPLATRTTQVAGVEQRVVEVNIEYALGARGKAWSVDWACTTVNQGSNALGCEFENPRMREGRTFVRGNAPQKEAYDYQAATDRARELTPGPISVFSISLQTDGSPDPTSREEFLSYNFFHPLAGESSGTINQVGVRIDSATGRIISAALPARMSN